MRVVIVNRVEFEDWEKAYLLHLGFSKAQIKDWEDCVTEFDPNVFSGKKVEGFKAGYDMAVAEYRYSEYNEEDGF